MIDYRLKCYILTNFGIEHFRKQLMPQLMLSVMSSVCRDNVWVWIYVFDNMSAIPFFVIYNRSDPYPDHKAVS